MDTDIFDVYLLIGYTEIYINIQKIFQNVNKLEIHWKMLVVKYEYYYKVGLATLL